MPVMSPWWWVAVSCWGVWVALAVAGWEAPILLPGGSRRLLVSTGMSRCLGLAREWTGAVNLLPTTAGTSSCFLPGGLRVEWDFPRAPRCASRRTGLTLLGCMTTANGGSGLRLGGFAGSNNFGWWHLGGGTGTFSFGGSLAAQETPPSKSIEGPW